MSKTAKYPAYSGGSIGINGNNKASTQKEGNTIKSDFNMNDTEKDIYNSIQSNMSDVLGNLFSISDPQRNEWQSYLNTLQNVGLQSINDIYTPLQNSLKNDIASRFGNLDNSVFLDKLSAITNNKSKAIADLTNNILLSQNNLYNQEIQNRIGLLTLLDGLNNSINSNILSYLSLANQNANSGNQYNQAAYKVSAQNNPFGTLGTSLLNNYGMFV